MKKHFTKLSSNPETASQLVANRPAVFTGSEVFLTASYFILNFVLQTADSLTVVADAI